MRELRADVIEQIAPGVKLHALIAHQEYADLEVFLRENPQLPVDYVDAHGNSVLHVILQQHKIDILLVHHFIRNGYSLSQRNDNQATPLLLALSHAFAEDLIKSLINNFSAQIPLADIQELFCQAARMQHANLQLFLLEKFPKQLDVNASVDIVTGNHAIHQAVLAPEFDVCLVAMLLAKGATLQDVNLKKQTPIALLLENKQYDRVKILVADFAEQLQPAQLETIFLRLAAEKQYNLYGEMLLMKRNTEREVVLHCLAESASHLSFPVVSTLVKQCIKDNPQDLSVLKYIGVVQNVKRETKKQFVSDIVKEQINRFTSAADVCAFVKKLEMEADEKGSNLSFLRDRTSCSLHGHKWKGKPVSGTWAYIMEYAQKKILQISQSLCYSENNETIENFMRQSTRERHFTVTTWKPTEASYQKYLQNCYLYLKADTPACAVRS